MFLIHFFWQRQVSPVLHVLWSVYLSGICFFIHSVLHSLCTYCTVTSPILWSASLLYSDESVFLFHKILDFPLWRIIGFCFFCFCDLSFDSSYLFPRVSVSYRSCSFVSVSYFVSVTLSLNRKNFCFEPSPQQLWFFVWVKVYALGGPYLHFFEIFTVFLVKCCFCFVFCWWFYYTYHPMFCQYIFKIFYLFFHCFSLFDFYCKYCLFYMNISDNSNI